MVAPRIIPCLDVLNGRVVKGKKFQGLIDAGDPVELAAKYSEDGADEIVLLDISASLERRRPFFDIVERVAKRVAIPLTVGGGVRTLDDILALLRRGADKVSLNSVLHERPEILAEAAGKVGRQALVATIDVMRDSDGWSAHIKSGTVNTKRDALDWAATLVNYGAGELLATSIDKDGTKEGYDTALLKALSRIVRVPIIASGGAGIKDHILEAFQSGAANAVLAASIFHFNEVSIEELKRYLFSEGIMVRI